MASAQMVLPVPGGPAKLKARPRPVECRSPRPQLLKIRLCCVTWASAASRALRVTGERMTSSKARRGVMVSTALRPVMPNRRENVLGPTRYTIPWLSARINATAPVLRTWLGQLLYQIQAVFSSSQVNPKFFGDSFSIVERLRSLSGQACLSSSCTFTLPLSRLLGTPGWQAIR